MKQIRPELLLIDNFDSFTYNLVEQLSPLVHKVRIFRNNIDLDSFMQQVIDPQRAQMILLSPGPGNPKSAGICLPLIQKCAGKLPILGICLGHQAIIEAYGGEISAATTIVHGKACPIQLEPQEKRLFEGLNTPFKAARYHSLAASKIPDELQVIATADQEIMAVKHKTLPILGYQFHPESILTTQGSQLMQQSIDWLLERHPY